MLAKICGFSHLDNLQELINYTQKTQQELPDLIGVIFDTDSPRAVPDQETAAQIVETAHQAGIKTVAVFKNHTKAKIDKVLTAIPFDYLQLHGQETPQFCSQFDIPIIKTHILSSEATQEQQDQQIATYIPHVKYILLERPKQDKTSSRNIQIINQFASKFPIILAGGLTPENIKDILGTVKSPLIGIDLAAGVESAPGIKNPRKTAEIVSIAHTS